MCIYIQCQTVTRIRRAVGNDKGGCWKNPHITAGHDSSVPASPQTRSSALEASLSVRWRFGPEGALPKAGGGALNGSSLSELSRKPVMS